MISNDLDIVMVAHKSQTITYCHVFTVLSIQKYYLTKEANILQCHNYWQNWKQIK